MINVVNFHMKDLVKKLSFLILFFTFSWTQECEEGFIWIEDIPTCCGAPAQHCFYESDLNVLQEMIDNSSETINMLLDDNEDGVITYFCQPQMVHDVLYGVGLEHAKANNHSPYGFIGATCLASFDGRLGLAGTRQYHRGPRRAGGN